MGNFLIFKPALITEPRSTLGDHSLKLWSLLLPWIDLCLIKSAFF